MTTCCADEFQSYFPYFVWSKHLPWLFHYGDMDVTCHPNLDLVEDAKQRDLTINALYATLSNGKVVFLDPLGRGLPDLSKALLVTVHPFVDSMREDPIRLLRFIKQWFKSNWEHPYSPATIRALLPELRRAPFGVYLLNIERLFALNANDAWLLLMKHDLLQRLFFQVEIPPMAHNSHAISTLYTLYHQEQLGYKIIGYALGCVYHQRLRDLDVLDPDQSLLHEVIDTFLANWHDDAFTETYTRMKTFEIIKVNMLIVECLIDKRPPSPPITFQFDQVGAHSMTPKTLVEKIKFINPK